MGRRLAELAALDSLADAAWMPGVRIAEKPTGEYEYSCGHGLQLVLTCLSGEITNRSDPLEVHRIILERVEVDNLASVMERDEE